MSEKVHLTKNGIQVLAWDGDAGQYVERAVSTVLAVLRCDCYMDAGVTMADIFRAVEPHTDLVQFLRAWSHCDVEAFHAEARKPAAGQSDLLYIEISRKFEWDEDGAYPSLHVCGVGEPDEGGLTHYGIDMTPVSEIVNLPVRIRPRMEIFDDRKKVAEVPCEFTLLDVLGEIYWEISFFGSPTMRDEKVAELEEMARALRKGGT